VWVVVGLGNPGRRYVDTRHNVGFRVVDRLASRWATTVSRSAHRALVGEARRGEERVLLVKPQTYMNESGESVASVQRFYRTDANRVIVIHDDVDLPTARLRVRVGGKAGGNRGVESIIALVADPDFVRVKVGIGRPVPGPVPSSWVLGVPAAAEAAGLSDAEERAADAVELVLAEGPDRAMNRYNQKEAPHGGPPL
jgi:peptidyl-tRNA hydrolase, PTH1 family